MASDWIKVRMELWDHPKVIQIVSAFCPQNVRNLSERCRVIGALFKTWSLADTYTENGILYGYNAESLDAAVGIDGWSLSLQHVGWLSVNSQSITVPRFTDHNGESAKRRAEDAKRKKNVRKTSANKRTKCGLEKRREEKNISSPKGEDTSRVSRVRKQRCAQEDTPEFLLFWSAYPSGRKKSKAKAREAWAKAIGFADPQAIIAAAVDYAGSDEGRGPYVKMPSTWLNQECWNDDRRAWERKADDGGRLSVDEILKG